MAFPPPPETTRTRESPGLPSLAGDLSRVAASDVLQLLGYLSLSGTIEFERGAESEGDRIRFQVCRGRLVDANCSGPHLRLGELLVRRYSVAIEAVLDHLRYQREERERTGHASRLGERLLAAGYLRGEVLRRALEDAATRLAFRVLTWKDGRFSYWSRDIPSPDDISPDLGLEELVLERWHGAESQS